MHNRIPRPTPSLHLTSVIYLLSWLCLFAVFSGCAWSDVGRVDLRRAITSSAISDSKNAEQLPLRMKNFSLGNDTVISTNDSVSVTLRTAFIKHFFELGFNQDFLSNPLEMFKSDGEIAIVANAFEVETGKELDFANTQSGRLVFFSDDVKRGQPLNLNSLPIYGPKTFSGQPFAFRVTIFELDSGTEQAKSLLGSLANAGSAAYAPASPVLTLLNGIGQSLFTGEQNDTEFRYTMQFHPKHGHPDMNSFVFEVGNYVFLRLQDRRANVPWEHLVLNENEGVLYWKKGTCPGYVLSGGRACPDTSDPEPYTENSYLVVEVNTGGSAKDIDLAENTFDELLNVLDIRDKEAAARLTGATSSLTEVMGGVLAKRTRSTNFNAAKEALVIVRDLDKPVSKRRSQAEEIYALLTGSLKKDGTMKQDDPKGGPALSKIQVDYVIAKLRRLVEKRNNILSEADFELLSHKTIGDKQKKKEILDILAPFQPPA